MAALRNGIKIFRAVPKPRLFKPYSIPLSSNNNLTTNIHTSSDNKNSNIKRLSETKNSYLYYKIKNVDTITENNNNFSKKYDSKCTSNDLSLFKITTSDLKLWEASVKNIFHVVKTILTKTEDLLNYLLLDDINGNNKKDFTQENRKKFVVAVSQKNTIETVVDNTKNVKEKQKNNTTGDNGVRNNSTDNIHKSRNGEANKNKPVTKTFTTQQNYLTGYYNPSFDQNKIITNDNNSFNFMQKQNSSTDSSKRTIQNENTKNENDRNYMLMETIRKGLTNYFKNLEAKNLKKIYCDFLLSLEPETKNKCKDCQCKYNFNYRDYKEVLIENHILLLENFNQIFTKYNNRLGIENINSNCNTNIYKNCNILRRSKSILNLLFGKEHNLNFNHSLERVLDKNSIFHNNNFNRTYKSDTKIAIKHNNNSSMSNINTSMKYHTSPSNNKNYGKINRNNIIKILKSRSDTMITALGDGLKKQKSCLTDNNGKNNSVVIKNNIKPYEPQPKQLINPPFQSEFKEQLNDSIKLLKALLLCLEKKYTEEVQQNNATPLFKSNIIKLEGIEKQLPLQKEMTDNKKGKKSKTYVELVRDSLQQEINLPKDSIKNSSLMVYHHFASPIRHTGGITPRNAKNENKNQMIQKKDIYKGYMSARAAERGIINQKDKTRKDVYTDRKDFKMKYLPEYKKNNSMTSTADCNKVENNGCPVKGDKNLTAEVKIKSICKESIDHKELQTNIKIKEKTNKSNSKKEEDATYMDVNKGKKDKMKNTLENWLKQNLPSLNKSVQPSTFTKSINSTYKKYEKDNKKNMRVNKLMSDTQIDQKAKCNSLLGNERFDVANYVSQFNPFSIIQDVLGKNPLKKSLSDNALLKNSSIARDLVVTIARMYKSLGNIIKSNIKESPYSVNEKGAIENKLPDNKSNNKEKKELVTQKRMVDSKYISSKDTDNISLKTYITEKLMVTDKKSILDTLEKTNIYLQTNYKTPAIKKGNSMTKIKKDNIKDTQNIKYKQKNDEFLNELKIKQKKQSTNNPTYFNSSLYGNIKLSTAKINHPAQQNLSLEKEITSFYEGLPRNTKTIRVPVRLARKIISNHEMKHMNPFYGKQPMDKTSMTMDSSYSEKLAQEKFRTDKNNDNVGVEEVITWEEAIRKQQGEGRKEKSFSLKQRPADRVVSNLQVAKPKHTDPTYNDFTFINNKSNERRLKPRLTENISKNEEPTLKHSDKNEHKEIEEHVKELKGMNEVKALKWLTPTPEAKWITRNTPYDKKLEIPQVTNLLEHYGTGQAEYSTRIHHNRLDKSRTVLNKKEGKHNITKFEQNESQLEISKLENLTKQMSVKKLRKENEVLINSIKSSKSITTQGKDEIKKEQPTVFKQDDAPKEVWQTKKLIPDLSPKKLISKTALSNFIKPIRKPSGTYVLDKVNQYEMKNLSTKEATNKMEQTNVLHPKKLKLNKIINDLMHSKSDGEIPERKERIAKSLGLQISFKIPEKKQNINLQPIKTITREGNLKLNKMVNEVKESKKTEDEFNSRSPKPENENVNITPAFKSVRTEHVQITKDKPERILKMYRRIENNEAFLGKSISIDNANHSETNSQSRLQEAIMSKIKAHEYKLDNHETVRMTTWYRNQMDNLHDAGDLCDISKNKEEARSKLDVRVKKMLKTSPPRGQERFIERNNQSEGTEKVKTLKKFFSTETGIEKRPYLKNKWKMPVNTNQHTKVGDEKASTVTLNRNATESTPKNNLLNSVNNNITINKKLSKTTDLTENEGISQILLAKKIMYEQPSPPTPYPISFNSPSLPINVTSDLHFRIDRSEAYSTLANLNKNLYTTAVNSIKLKDSIQEQQIHKLNRQQNLKESKIRSELNLNDFRNTKYLTGNHQNSLKQKGKDNRESYNTRQVMINDFIHDHNINKHLPTLNKQRIKISEGIAIKEGENNSKTISNTIFKENDHNLLKTNSTNYIKPVSINNNTKVLTNIIIPTAFMLADSISLRKPKSLTKLVSITKSTTRLLDVNKNKLGKAENSQLIKTDSLQSVMKVAYNQTNFNTLNPLLNQGKNNKEKINTPTKKNAPATDKNADADQENINKAEEQQRKRRRSLKMANMIYRVPDGCNVDKFDEKNQFTKY